MKVNFKGGLYDDGQYDKLNVGVFYTTLFCFFF